MPGGTDRADRDGSAGVGPARAAAPAAEAVALGGLRKMAVRPGDPAAYALRVGGTEIDLNARLGQVLSLRSLGEIRCLGCGRRTRRSYAQGHCYPCSRRLARCDLCIVKPELCHFHAGTCREPAWGVAHCMRPHVVYLANASGLKVGITRETELPTRWLDQGASQALPIVRTASRHQAGLVEALLRRHVADRTDWRAMLRGDPAPRDLPAERDDLLERCRGELADLGARLGAGALASVAASPVALRYPVRAYPDRVRARSLEREEEVAGVLEGIKGQYLLLDRGVINIRRFSGYQVAVAFGGW